MTVIASYTGILAIRTLEETAADIEDSISEDPKFQRRDWIAQRIGWFVGGLILAAALLGVLGNGPLSTATVKDPEARFSAEYQRFARWESPSQLKVMVAETASDTGQLSIWFQRSYFDSMRVEQITPEPLSMESDGDRISMSFESAASTPLEVHLHLASTKFGFIQGTLGIKDSPGVQFGQFIYP